MRQLVRVDGDVTLGLSLNRPDLGGMQRCYDGCGW